MENKEKQEGQFQLELPQNVARVLPGLPKAVINSRVILAPEHAKRLLMALQENVAKYEHEFGKIQLPGQEGKTIAPFNVNKGEA